MSDQVGGTPESTAVDSEHSTTAPAAVVAGGSDTNGAMKIPGAAAAAAGAVNGAAETPEAAAAAAAGTAETAAETAAGTAEAAVAAVSDAVAERVQATVSSGALLAYETQMLLETLAEDGLLVTARGLGLERLVAALVRVHCDPGQLVLVMGTGRPEEEYIAERLAADGVTPMPRTVTADTSVSER